MKIKIEKESLIPVKDVRPGDLFIIPKTNEMYMRTDDRSRMLNDCISVRDGSTKTINAEFMVRPVVSIIAKV